MTWMRWEGERHAGLVGASRARRVCLFLSELMKRECVLEKGKFLFFSGKPHPLKSFSFPRCLLQLAQDSGQTLAAAPKGGWSHLPHPGSQSSSLRSLPSPCPVQMTRPPPLTSLGLLRTPKGMWPLGTSSGVQGWW